jgi:hypothetical protein
MKQVATRKQAIDAKCKDCAYDPQSRGTWRDQVEVCRSEYTCALWPFRPVSTATIKERKAAKYDGMTDEQKATYHKRQEAAKERFSK